MSLCEPEANGRSGQVRTGKAFEIWTVFWKSTCVLTEANENQHLLCQMCQKQRKFLAVFAVALREEGVG